MKENNNYIEKYINLILEAKDSTEKIEKIINDIYEDGIEDGFNVGLID